jgi:hypothetical protein
LSRKLEHERIVGNILGLQITRRAKNLNHSQFAEDTLLLGGASMIIARRFKLVLDFFLDAPRGATNHIKCQIMG